MDKKSKFEESIEEAFRHLIAEFHAEDPSSTPGVSRTGSSISRRFLTVLQGYLSFYGIVQRVWNAKLTGLSSGDDILNAFTAIYNELAKVCDMYSHFGSSTLRVGKPFPYLNCYQWRQKVCLWKMIIRASDANKNYEKTTKEKVRLKLVRFMENKSRLPQPIALHPKGVQWVLIEQRRSSNSPLFRREGRWN